MSAESANNGAELSLWLLSRTGESEKAWLVQACKGTERELSRTGEPWQVPITSNGLQRMVNKWSNSGRPTLALKVDAHGPLNADDKSVCRWQVCAPGTRFNNRLLKADERDLNELRVLAKMKMPTIAVCDTNALSIPYAHPPSTTSADPATEKRTETDSGFSTKNSVNETSQPSPTHSEPHLARLLRINRGSAALSPQSASVGHFLPRADSLLLAIVIACSCTFADLYLNPSTTISSSSTGTNVQLERQLADACKPLDASHVQPRP